jgi:hypothetical protein
VRGGEEGKERSKDKEEWSWKALPMMNIVYLLLLLNSLGAPYFTGKNITAFVQLIEDLFEDC